MKTKAKSIVALILLMICMSSCVYSLFPIYTKDTLVYLPELVGKWQVGEDPEHYLIFKAPTKLDGTITMTSKETVELDNGGVVVLTQKMTLGVGGDSYVLVDGDTVRDIKGLKELYAKKKVDKNTQGKVAEATRRMLEEIREGATTFARPGADPLVYDDITYELTYVDGDEEYRYEAHLTTIGEDIFMDLYATEDSFSDAAFGSNVWFPVHTFMKLELENDELRVTEFDLEKMTKLFDSNLVRIRHENVDGTVLITAGTKELRKFLDRYSDDESVFEKPELYTRVTE